MVSMMTSLPPTRDQLDPHFTAQTFKIYIILADMLYMSFDALHLTSCAPLKFVEPPVPVSLGLWTVKPSRQRRQADPLG